MASAIERPAAWAGFVGGDWENRIDVRDFIQKKLTRLMKATAASWRRPPKPPPSCGRK